MTDDRQIPVVVDLDGTLINSDLLIESFYAMLRQKPLLIFAVPIWLLKGKNHLKNRIAAHVDIAAELLPYNQEFLNHLHEVHSQGRTLVLATASIRKFAHAVASHLHIFSDVLASDETINLKGKRKSKALVERYGEKGFDYAGNEYPDLQIFIHARQAIVVNASADMVKKSHKIGNVAHVFAGKKPTLFTYCKAIRIYQWVKNFLLFIPLVMAHQWDNIPSIMTVALGFISFGCCASAGYLFNDFLDLNADRKHPRKKNRPLASGAINGYDGTYMMLTLETIGLWLAASLSWPFFALLIFYTVLTLSYTFHLKKYVLIDVLVLASLYTLRVVAGGVLAEVELSFWLLSFSVFIFFSLALVKRCSELETLSKTNVTSARGKDYSIADIDYLREMGIASGYMAILVVAFYINSDDVKVHYSNQKMLWLICPVLFYWVSRIWLKTGRGEMTDDPIVFSVKDRGSRVVMLALLIIILLAT